MPEINWTPRLRPDVIKRALPSPLVQIILQIPHRITGLPIPCLDLHLLLLLVLLGLEYNPLPWTDSVGREPLFNTTGLSWVPDRDKAGIDPWLLCFPLRGMEYYW